MRYGTVNGNGSICDMCGKILLPRDVIKIKFLKLVDDERYHTGTYVNAHKGKDLCIDCYNKLLKSFIH